MKPEQIFLSVDAFTPETLTMSRLAEYLKPFAAMLGSEASVHFDRVANGSASLKAFIEPPAAPKVRERAQSVASGTAPKSAMKAYCEIDKLLAQDNAIGRVEINGHNVIEFPGRRRAAQEIIGPVRRSTSIEGKVSSIAGKDETINIHLRDGDEDLRCVVSISLARRLGSYLLGGRVRLFGHGLWNRVDGEWQMKTFTADDFVGLNESALPGTLEVITRSFEGISPDVAAATLLELRHE
jgi:hypothetical protein